MLLRRLFLREPERCPVVVRLPEFEFEPLEFEL